MSRARTFSFVVAVNDNQILKRNLLASPCLETGDHQVLLRKGFSSAAQAYNSALDLVKNEVVIFAHQDMYFPQTWTGDLNRALDRLEERDRNWGVLGCYGVTADNQGRGYLYSPGQGFLGNSFAEPVSVQTLDEITLIVRKSSGLKFDESLSHYHLYGPDICLRAHESEMRSYAIAAFCIHNAQLNLILPPEFYNSYREFKKLWSGSLPVQTSCIRITRFDLPMRMRRLREAYLKFSGKKYGTTRVKDPKRLLSEILQASSPAAHSEAL